MGFSKAERIVVATGAALVFSRVFGLSLVMPTFRGHYEGAFQVDPLWIGIAFGAHGLTMALMQLPLGLLSDRIGRRPVLVAATLLFVLGSVGAALAPSIGWLIAARLMQGLGAVSSTAMALVGETVDPARRTTAMALIGIPAGMGFFLGMMAGPLLAPLVSVPGLFWITAAIGLLAGLPALSVPRGAPARAAPEQVPGARMGLPVLALALGGFTMNLALAAVLFNLGDNAGWQRLLPALAVALVFMVVAGRLIDKSGLTWQPVTLGILGLAIAAPFAAGATGALAFFIAGAAFFSMHATLSAVLPSQVSRVAGRSGGRGHGIQNVVQYLGTFAGGALAGASVGSGGLLAFVVLAAAAATATFLMVWTRSPATAGVPTA